MNIEQLLKLGLNEEQAQQVMAGLDGSFVTKARFNEINERYKTAKAGLEAAEAANGELAGLKAQLLELQDQADTQKQAWQSARLEAALDGALQAAGAKNPATVKPLLDLSAAELAADGQIAGLAAQLEALKQAPNSSFLFGSGPRQGFCPQAAKDGLPGPGGPLSLAEAVSLALSPKN